MQDDTTLPLTLKKTVFKIASQREQLFEHLKVAISSLHIREPLPGSNAAGAILRNANIQLAAIGIRESRDCPRQFRRRHLDRFEVAKMRLIKK